jgi:hypothetical protein
MSYGTLLAPWQSSAGVVYGKGHALNFADDVQFRVFQSEGKVASFIPAARAIGLTAVAATTATITFTVDQPAWFIRVLYGPTMAFGSQQDATPPSGVGTIVCNLTGLTMNTTYYYFVRLHDVSGSTGVDTAPLTFKTL